MSLNPIIQAIVSSIVKPIVSKDGFTSETISGLRLWVDAADASTITTATGVSVWGDKSGNGNDATQGSATAQPATGTTTQNGLNTLDFDGTNDMLNFPNLGLNGTSSNTIFFVTYIDSTTSGFDNPLSFGSGSEGRLETSSGGGDVLKSVGLGIKTSDTNIWSGGVDDAYNAYMLTTNGTTVTAELNGVAEYSDTQDGNWSTGAGVYGIMSSNTPNRWTKGKVAEILIYDRALSASEIAIVNNYLKAKWGL